MFKIQFKQAFNYLIRILFLKRFFGFIHRSVKSADRSLRRFVSNTRTSRKDRSSNHSINRSVKSRFRSILNRFRMPATNENSTENTASTDSSPNQPAQSILRNKIELALAATRTISIICTILYVVPFLGKSVQYR